MQCLHSGKGLYSYNSESIVHANYLRALKRDIGKMHISVFSLLFTWLFACILTLAKSTTHCEPRQYNYDSIVCVCNSTYCDTVQEPSPPLKQPYFDAYVSTRDGLRFHYTQGLFSDETQQKSVVFEVGNATFQTILGFGGAFTDAATITMAKLSPKARANLINSYFSPNGIEYSIGRIPMASCDFSERIYSYDDTEGDLKLNNFKLQKEDTKLKIPIIKDAMKASKRNISFFGSPWSSPAWMKTNNNMTGKGTIKGIPGEPYYKAWAQYFVKFIQAYERQGIPIWGLTAQNEPSDGLIPGFAFQCLGWTAELQRDFIARDLGPALQDAGYGHVKLMILDDQRIFLPAWAEVVLRDPEAAKYISGIAVHWYLDLFISPLALHFTYKEFGDNYFILNTEACEQDLVDKNNSVQLGNWFRGERYFRDIVQDLQNGVGGWIDWNIALDMTGGPNWENNRADSPVIVNSAKDEFYKQPMFYAMGHFSKFVVPGSKVLEFKSNASGDSNIEAIFFRREDNSIVANFINFGDSSTDVQVTDPNVKSGSINFSLPVKSFVTLIWP